MNSTSIPNSRLTLARPDIWARGLALATRLTGYEYAPKMPLPDGTIFSCGGWAPPDTRTPEQKIDDEIKNRKASIGYWKRYPPSKEHDEQIAYEEKKIEELEKQKKACAPVVFVPEGGMEWLLHEVGHWVAATQAERALPDYGIPIDAAYDDKANIKTSGFGYDREWQAWAFEEIVLAPFGPARSFCAPSHRGGIGFSKIEIPRPAFAHIERRLVDERIAVDEWRVVMADWVQWGASLALAPWAALTRGGE